MAKGVGVSGLCPTNPPTLRTLRRRRLGRAVSRPPGRDTVVTYASWTAETESQARDLSSRERPRGLSAQAPAPGSRRHGLDISPKPLQSVKCPAASFEPSRASRPATARWSAATARPPRAGMAAAPDTDGPACAGHPQGRVCCAEKSRRADHQVRFTDSETGAQTRRPFRRLGDRFTDSDNLAVAGATGQKAPAPRLRLRSNGP